MALPRFLALSITAHLPLLALPFSHHTPETHVGAADDADVQTVTIEQPREVEVDETKPASAATQPLVEAAKPHRVVSRGGGAGHRGTGAMSCAAYARTPHDPSLSYLEFQVTYETDGSPVVGVPYRVTLPDGTVREGATDERGLVCYTAVKAGDAKIEFLRYANHMRYIGSSPRAI